MAGPSASEKAKSTIVIKRIKKGGHGGHSAAWKIAYADFVTAMMAFFLLMWLLGSTTKGDLKGIADYFNSPLKVAMQGGDGSGDATSIITGGGEDLTKSVGQVRRGDNNTRKRATEREIDELKKSERKQMRKLKREVEQALLANPKLSEFQNQIRIEITPDGLRIQIVDDFKRPMFNLGSAQVQPYMREILHDVGQVLNGVDNKVALTGHTDSARYARGDGGYSNWELSADRANASRRELITGGMSAEKVLRVVGLADSALLIKDDPKSPLNRRISIIVLNKSAEERLARAGGEIEAGTVEPEPEPNQEPTQDSGIAPSITPLPSPEDAGSMGVTNQAVDTGVTASASMRAPEQAPTPEGDVHETR